MQVRTRFRNRLDAGRRLAESLQRYAGRQHLLILALPRGGVPVGYEVARSLNAPLDVMLVRKLGVPGHEELAMGAIASGGVRILSEEVIAAYAVTERAIAAVAAQEKEELDRQERIYRAGRSLPVGGRTVILVDDGLATGSTMLAAARAIRAQGPQHLGVAVPVAPSETCAALKREVDDVTCLISPSPFFAVGNWYEDFDQITDEEVHQLLERAAETTPAEAPWW